MPWGLSWASEDAKWANSAVKESNWQQEDDSSRQFPTWRGFPFAKPASFSCLLAQTYEINHAHVCEISFWTFWLDWLLPTLFSQLCSWSVCGHGPGDAQCALAFLHRKRDGDVTLTCSTTSSVSAGHENRRCTDWAKLLLFLLISFIPPPSLLSTKRGQPCPRLHWFGHKNLRRCFVAPSRLKGAWEEKTVRTRQAFFFFSSSSSSPSSCTWSECVTRGIQNQMAEI